MPRTRSGPAARACTFLALAAAWSCAPAAPRDSLQVAVPYEVSTLDPHARNTLSNFALVLHFYEALVTTDADLKIQPGLAMRWDTPDPSTWIFHLREGVRFHSGKPLRAADVVYSFRRLQHDNRLEVASYLFYVDQVDAVDPLTVRVRTSSPLNVLLNRIRFVAIVPEGSSSESLQTHVDGTGPFRLAEWKKDERLRMTRNEEYWGKKPALRQAEFLLARTPERAIADLLSGRCQLAQCNFKTLDKSLAGKSRFRIHHHPSLFLKYLGFDFGEDTPFASVKPNPFRNPLVRQAVDHAIDRPRLVAALSTNAAPATQIVSPLVFGFDPSIRLSAYDPARSRALLAEAGLPGGFETTLHARQFLAEAAFELRNQLRAVGIRLDVKLLPDDDFFDLLARHGATLHLSRFGCVTGDAADILGLAIHSVDPARRLGLGNVGGYKNPEVDRLIEESARIDSPADRLATLQKVMSLVVADLAWVPLYIDEDVYAVDRTLSWRPRNDGFILATEVVPQP